MLYVNQCGSCIDFKDLSSDSILYDVGNAAYVKGHCVRYKCCYYPDDSCSHYEARSEDANCYITTIVCQRMGLDDKCQELQILRGFRDNILQKDEKYKDILFEYDTVGPKIAKKLMSEDENIIIILFNKFIKPIAELITMNQNDLAISKYKSMTKILESTYCFTFDGVVDSSYDSSLGGHGILKSLVKDRKKD